MSGLKETLTKQIKINYIVGVIVLSLLILCLYSSYAIFTVSVEKKSALNITAGNLYPSITSSSLDKDNRIGVLPGNEVTLDIRLENINSIEARVNLYYKILNPEATGVTIGYLSNKDTPPTEVGYNLSSYGITGNYFRTISVKIKNEGTVPAIIEFGTNVGLKHNDLTIPELSSILALFEEETTGAEYIESIFTDNTDTMANDDPDGNIRYIGADPANYVNFNGELWRIIGLFNVDDGTGKKEKRLKIIRNESIGNYSWDTSPGTINNGFGINEWSQADLMTLLNKGPYWNRQSGTCYVGQTDKTEICLFGSTGLTPNAKTLIGNVKWNLGTVDGKTNTATNTNAPTFYNAERSANTGKTCTSGNYCNDTVRRTTTWTGMVGLMYPSDYGYATKGGTTTNRATCLTNPLYKWSGLSDCYNNDWLYDGSITNYERILTPHPNLYAYGVLELGHAVAGNERGSILAGRPDLGHLVRPVVYLKADVKILDDGRNGTRTYPYNLSL